MSEMAKRFLQTTEPDVVTATEGKTSVSDAWHGHDAQLTETAQDFDQDEDIGPAINQQLADIRKKQWFAKLSEPKLKEKMEKYSRPENCGNVAIVWR